MSEETNTIKNSNMEQQTTNQESIPHHEQVEEYGSGHIQARHGRINSWLLVVYTAMPCLNMDTCIGEVLVQD